MSTSRLHPHLTCRDAAGALPFYQRALGAETLMALHAPDGTLMHGCLRINGAEVFIGEECPAQGAHAPQAFAGTAVTMHLTVEDCDAAFARAIAAGCQARMPPQDMFWGDRYGMFVDPYGHCWAVATTLRVMSEAEIMAAMQEEFASQASA